MPRHLCCMVLDDPHTLGRLATCWVKTIVCCYEVATQERRNRVMLSRKLSSLQILRSLDSTCHYARKSTRVPNRGSVEKIAHELSSYYGVTSRCNLVGFPAHIQSTVPHQRMIHDRMAFHGKWYNQLDRADRWMTKCGSEQGGIRLSGFSRLPPCSVLRPTFFLIHLYVPSHNKCNWSVSSPSAITTKSSAIT